ncbi:MAG: hypothetical protein JWQ14_946 [Adhaeribacter sp.]|nr:hypothetical protein [Adhaeribacter sp.]
MAFSIVNEPALVGVTLLEVAGYNGQHVKIRSNGGVKQIVGRFLKPDKSFHAMTFPENLFIYLGQLPDAIGRKIFFNTLGTGKSEAGILVN